MKYMGSKNRHARHILPIILKDRRKGQWYVEPFVGGANVIDKVDGKRIGADNNEYIISLLKAMQNGWTPPTEITSETYKLIRDNKQLFSQELVGFVGAPCSYGGRWFEGMARGGYNSHGARNHILEAAGNIVKQSRRIHKIKFLVSDYKELEIPPKSIIYCDPPYNNAKKYKTKFNTEEFWEWCNKQVEIGHTVFVSEYEAPDDWRCVWQKEVNSSLTKNTGSKKAVEKLFTKVKS